MLKRTIGDILTPHIISVTPQTKVIEAIALMKDKKISCLVVMDNDEPKGLFTERDVVRAAKSGNIDDIPVKDLMSREIITAKNTATIYEAYNIFEENSIRHLVIEDAGGKVIGMLTQSDIINNIGLEFFVSLKNASDIMTGSIMSLKRKNDSFLDAIDIMTDRRISCIVVEDNKKPIGILTERDITRLILDKIDAKISIENIMSSPVFSIDTDTPVYEAARIMKAKNIRRLVVVDSEGIIAGLITQSDIVKGLKGRYMEFLKEIIHEQEQALLETGNSLMASEKKYRTLVNNAPVGIYRSNINGEFLFANKALADIFEFTSVAEIMRLGTLQRYKNVNDRAKFIEMLKKTGRIDGMELEMMTMNCKPIHVFVNAVLEDDEISGMVIDITKRKHYENMILEKNSELATLYAISSEISKTIDLDRLFDDVLRVITSRETLNIKRRGGILLVEGDRLRLVRHMGHTDDFLKLHEDLKIGDCLCGLAVKNGDIIISGNSHDDHRHTVRYNGMEPHGHIIIPLKAKDTVVGVLYLYLPADIEVSKNVITLLNGIGNQIGVAIENARLYEETKALSLRDSLTGLANRRLMEIVFERLMPEAKRYKKPLSAMVLDIDHFKKYNDTYGHMEGDKLLKKTAGLIAAETREADLVVRYGGEEFVVLLPDCGIQDAAEAAERIRKSIESDTPVTISIGISSYSEGMHTLEDLITSADNALYEAKKSGRNRICIS